MSTPNKNCAGRLAAAFVARLAFEIGTSNLSEVCKQNSLLRGMGRTSECASHDHCDANMTMLAAWSDLRSDEFDPNSDEQAALWNAAWEIAFHALASIGDSAD